MTSTHESSAASPWVRGAIELSAQTRPSASSTGAAFFAGATPFIAIEPSDDFALELGAELRFDAATRSLRGQDWDERSDFGQLLRQLRLGHDGGAFQLEAGPVSAFTLGTGQLISRYSNRTNADYHPASADLAFFAGPLRTELFASDVLGARLFAGEVALDLGRTFSRNTEWYDRVHLALSAVHDFGRAGGVSAPITLAWTEVDGAMVRTSKGQLAAYVGGGGRVGSLPGTQAMGATVGVAGEVEISAGRLGARLEGRAHGSEFRQGLIGFDYELSRFPVAVPEESIVPVVIFGTPGPYSLHAELGAQLTAGVVASLSAERFTSGRTDLDLSVEAHGFHDRGALGIRAAAIGLGEDSRLLVSADARYRFLPSLYVVASGGTAYAPRMDGSPSRGLFASLGLGADFAR